MAKDFCGQDLQGRSFKNQDLTSADFSDCDLRGVDFSGANLTGAKFCRARMGRTTIYTLLNIVVKIAIGFLAGYVIPRNNIVFVDWIKNSLAQWSVSIEQNYSIIILSIYIFILGFTIIVDYRFRRFFYLYIFLAISFLIFGFLGGALIFTTVGSIAGALIITMSVAAIITLQETSSIIIATIGSLLGVITIAYIEHQKEQAIGSGIIFLLFAIYLFYDSLVIKSEPLKLFVLLGAKLNCIGGTKFSMSNLTDVDFSKSDLRYSCFSLSKIIRCNFNQAKNHYLTLTECTPLESRKVRDLVIDGIITDKNFSTLDLRGLDFSNLNLQGFDFSHANLSGANLSHTQMTGAILEGWAIDTETRLDDIECNYYYYLEDGEKKRMPPEGEEYKAGEFTRIFQKIANTIDFIAHNEMELAAIKLSVEQVRVESGNDEIRVQAIEEKDGFIVVKVNAPKTEDRGVLYHEVNSLIPEYETKIQSLMNEKHIQIGKIEVLKEQLKEQRDDFLATIKQQNLIQIEHHEGEIIMSEDNSRHFSGNNNNNVNLGDKTISTSITGSTVHGSVVTAEKVENSFNTIQSLPPEHDELKALLSQLQDLINKSTLPDHDKQEALAETKTIAEATTKPKEEQETIVRKTLRYFKGLATDLADIPEIAVKLGVTVAGIASLFGL